MRQHSKLAEPSIDNTPCLFAERYRFHTDQLTFISDSSVWQKTNKEGLPCGRGKRQLTVAMFYRNANGELSTVYAKKQPTPHAIWLTMASHPTRVECPQCPRRNVKATISDRLRYRLYYKKTQTCYALGNVLITYRSFASVRPRAALMRGAHFRAYRTIFGAQGVQMARRFGSPRSLERISR